MAPDDAVQGVTAVPNTTGEALYNEPILVTTTLDTWVLSEVPWFLATLLIVNLPLVFKEPAV